MRDRLDLNEIDLNLLPKFRALYQFRNVSEAARALHLTQSALSNALARMRSTFDDELFLRTSTGMEPTPFAQSIAAGVERALGKLEGEFTRTRVFEPESSSRTFKIAMTQLGETWLAPGILSLTHSTAPDIVVSTAVGGDRGFEIALSGGGIDFAVGHLPDLVHNFQHAELAIHEIVYMVRDGHPILQGPATLSKLPTCTFVEVVERGTMYGEPNRAMMQLAPQNALRYRTANVMALPHVVAATDLVGIVPAWFGARCAASMGLRLLRFVEQPTFATIRLFWHRSLEQDPGHLWMRSIIARAAAAAQIEEAIQSAPIVALTASAQLSDIR
jgi:DNA-binding transcriptional LysR family regulator